MTRRSSERGPRQGVRSSAPPPRSQGSYLGDYVDFPASLNHIRDLLCQDSTPRKGWRGNKSPATTPFAQLNPLIGATASPAIFAANGMAPVFLIVATILAYQQSSETAKDQDVRLSGIFGAEHRLFSNRLMLLSHFRGIHPPRHARRRIQGTLRDIRAILYRTAQKQLPFNSAFGRVFAQGLVSSGCAIARIRGSYFSLEF